MFIYCENDFRQINVLYQHEESFRLEVVGYVSKYTNDWNRKPKNNTSLPFKQINIMLENENTQYKFCFTVTNEKIITLI